MVMRTSIQSSQSNLGGHIQGSRGKSLASRVLDWIIKKFRIPTAEQSSYNTYFSVIFPYRILVLGPNPQVKAKLQSNDDPLKTSEKIPNTQL